MRKLLIAMLGLALASCGPREGPVDVEALLPDPAEPGRFQLGTTTLDTAKDLHRGEGELFDVRGGFNINVQSLATALEEEQLDLDAMVERGRASYGNDMAPRLTWDGARYVADDFDSLLYLTLFESFEEAWRYYDDVIGDRSRATQDKSVVGFYGSLSLLDYLPLPIVTSDNAAYVAFADGWLTLRIVLASDGIPFAMNPGVIAHEFQHRVFFHNLFGDDDGFATWRAWVTGADQLTRAGNLVKGLDEGLADIFAAGHVRSAAFMSPSLEGLLAGEAAGRDLEGPLADSATYELLEDGGLEPALQRRCGERLARSGFNFYCLGTVVARSLYDGAGRDFDVLRGELLPAVNRALPEVGADIERRSEVEGELSFEMEVFLEAVARNLDDTDLRASVCAAFDERFASLMDPSRVPSCF